jgi:muconolactone delta-isomerase
MEFLVEFDVNVPDGAPESEVKYRAQSRSELDRLLRTLPLYDWMQMAVTPLETHPNDPAVGSD